MKFCILGDSGLAGQALVSNLLDAGHSVLGISTSALKTVQRIEYPRELMQLPRDAQKLTLTLEKFKPDALINCIALTNLTECEKKPELAFELHARLAEVLAEMTKMLGIHFTHISTDQVFDGKASTPYIEKDLTHPVHVYGKSKLLGEQNVRLKNPDALVVRTNIVGFRDHPENPAFAEWLCDALRTSQAITLFEDFITSSIHVRPFANLLLRAVHLEASGLLHLATRDHASKYEFGEKLAYAAGWDFSNVKKGNLKSSQMDPPRPGFLALDVGLAAGLLHETIASVDETIVEIVKDAKLRRLM